MTVTTPATTASRRAARIGERAANDAVEFTLGYPKKEDTSRRMTFEVASIGAAKGNPQWGAPTDKSVFIIKLGSRIK